MRRRSESIFLLGKKAFFGERKLEIVQNPENKFKNVPVAQARALEFSHRRYLEAMTAVFTPSLFWKCHHHVQSNEGDEQRMRNHMRE